MNLSDWKALPNGTIITATSPKPAGLSGNWFDVLIVIEGNGKHLNSRLIRRLSDNFLIHSSSPHYYEIVEMENQIKLDWRIR